jgi:hypothetical protein
MNLGLVRLVPPKKACCRSDSWHNLTIRSIGEQIERMDSSPIVKKGTRP